MKLIATHSIIIDDKGRNVRRLDASVSVMAISEVDAMRQFRDLFPIPLDSGYRREQRWSVLGLPVFEDGRFTTVSLEVTFVDRPIEHPAAEVPA